MVFSYICSIDSHGTQNKPLDFRIETNRLIIRPFTEDDIEPSYQLNLDEEVSRFTGDGGVVNKAEIERRIKENVMGDYGKYGYGRLAVEWKENGQFIGFTGLKYLDDMDEVDLGYRFKRDYWGKGIATETGKICLDYGFNTLGLTRIIALVLPENVGSIRVLEKLDFEFEKEVMEDGLLAQQYVVHRTKFISG